MAEISAVRESIRALGPIFDDTFAEERQSALQAVIPLLSDPIQRIDDLTRKIHSGEIF
jgi:hypothetical protein